MKTTLITTSLSLLLNGWSLTVSAADPLPGAEAQPASYFYTGKPYDADLEGYVFNYRTYSTHANRWTSADPAGFPDGPNNGRYAPVPTTQFDRLGLFPGVLNHKLDEALTYGAETITDWWSNWDPASTFQFDPADYGATRLEFGIVSVSFSVSVDTSINVEVWLPILHWFRDTQASGKTQGDYSLANKNWSIGTGSDWIGSAQSNHQIDQTYNRDGVTYDPYIDIDPETRLYGINRLNISVNVSYSLNVDAYKEPPQE